ncbi:MAG TPA: hypothetical protein PKY96_08395 [Flavobacteriales bacterium]|nr:hypothetical protein [Flavobacteriales bacterium]
MVALMLLIVFLGFAPSYYLRPWASWDEFYPEGLPWPHLIHGIILTVWYAFLLLQAALIRSKSVQLHRRLGWAGAVWALLVLGSTAWVMMLFPGRMQLLAAQRGTTVQELEPGLASLLWLDMFMGLLFAIFTGLAIARRREPAIHKRLMLFSGVVFLFAATSRIGGTLAKLTDCEPLALIGMVLLLAVSASILVHDRRTEGRILPVSAYCFSVYWAFFLLAMAIGSTDFGERITGL